MNLLKDPYLSAPMRVRSCSYPRRAGAGCDRSCNPQRGAHFRRRAHRSRLSGSQRGAVVE